MKTETTYSLQKYAGRNTRHTCPQCGRPHCFSLYVDNDGNALNETVGRCDHESSCGYHKTPKQYFDEHPSLRQDWRHSPSTSGQKRPSGFKTSSPRHTQRPASTKQLCTIPKAILDKSVRKDIPSSFASFLHTIFPAETVESLIGQYRLGVTRSRDVIYFQVDTKGNVRTGKIMKYDSQTGKRIKDNTTPSKINWVHSLMKHTGQLPKDWELTQCLFGEHLISEPQNRDKTIALVESEKTAVIASAIMPKYIWLATGGKSQLSAERLTALKGRKVIAFPDVDGYNEWQEKLSKIEGLTITVSDVLEKNATDKERYAHIDIADWLIKWRTECIKTLGGANAVPLPDNGFIDRDTPDHTQSDIPIFDNPNMQLVAKYFPAGHWPALEELIDEFDLIPTTIRIADPI